MQSNDCRCRAATFCRRYQKVMPVFPGKVGLFAGIQLRRPSLLCSGGARRGTPQPQAGREVGRGAGSRFGGPRSRWAAGGIYDGQHGGRDQTAVYRVLIGRHYLSPETEKAALGRQEFRGQGSGWKSAAVCWPRKLAVGRSATLKVVPAAPHFLAGRPVSAPRSALCLPISWRRPIWPIRRRFVLWRR